MYEVATNDCTAGTDVLHGNGVPLLHEGRLQSFPASVQLQFCRRGLKCRPQCKIYGIETTIII